MLWAERQQQRIFGGCSLQLEIELTTEALSKRERPRLVDAAAKGCMQNELHAAGFVEETLEHERLLRGDHSKRRASGNEVARRLFGTALAQSRFLHQPLGVTEVPAKIRHGARELVAARRRFPQPEGNRRWRSMRIADADRPGAHLHHLPRGVA